MTREPPIEMMIKRENKSTIEPPLVVVVTGYES